MREFVITVNSTVDLPKEWLEERHVPVLPLKYTIDGENYTDMSGLTAKEFFQKLREGHMSVTSQINPEEAREMLEPFVKEGKDVLHLGFSSGLSGTYNSMRIAAEELAEDYPEAKIIVIDTLCACLGEGLLLYYALKLKEEGKLKGDTIVGTVMSNIGFHKAAEELGMKTVSTAVGDRYVLEYMREHNLSIGGEQSGHVIFLDHNTTGDGMLTAVQVAALMKEKNQPLSELAGIMTKYPQVLLNVRVATKTGWEDNDLIKAAIVTAEGELGDEGRVLVRASGTEPLIRVMAEGPNQEELQSLCQEIADIIGREQGLAE